MASTRIRVTLVIVVINSSLPSKHDSDLAIYLVPKTLRKSSLVAYGARLVLCIAPDMFTSVAIPPVSALKVLRQVPHENATAGKVRPFLHQVKDLLFSIAANDGHIGQVDDQIAPA